MTQDTKTLKAEIISALDFLTLDNLKLLAKFVAFLRTNLAQEELDATEFEKKVETPSKRMRIASPHLAHREQAADFRKEVVWEADDDGL
jgi:hypothetical protein